MLVYFYIFLYFTRKWLYMSCIKISIFFYMFSKYFFICLVNIFYIFIFLYFFLYFLFLYLLFDKATAVHATFTSIAKICKAIFLHTQCRQTFPRVVGLPKGTCRVFIFKFSIRCLQCVSICIHNCSQVTIHRREELTLITNSSMTTRRYRGRQRQQVAV